MSLDNSQQAFFALVKAGLWEQDARLLQFEKISFQEVYRLAEEQSVVGLVAAGIDRFKIQDSGFKIPQKWALQFIGHALQLEQRNIAMNHFVARLMEKLRKEDIYAILVKGQGIAQCYEKPLWRSSGDVDLLLDTENYEKAKKVLVPLAVDVESEYKSFRHLGLTMPGGFIVELHGTLHSRLSKRVDRVIDEAQKDVFNGGNVRSWRNDNTTVSLPSPDNDIVFVFTHILHHFYIEGIGLRQICDWCRLLYTYKDSLNYGLLESRIKNAGLMSEWKAFAALAVDWLGMPVEVMPIYSNDQKWSRKAERIITFVLECGNFGHNRLAATGKISSAWYKIRDFVRHTRVFPWDSVKFFWHFLWNGIGLAVTK